MQLLKLGAQDGFQLLKRKSDALNVTIKEMCKVIYATKIEMKDQSLSAFCSLTHAEYAAGDFRKMLLEANMTAISCS